MLLPQASLLTEADEICRSLLTPEKLKNITDLIPEDWLQWEGDYGDAESIRQQYLEFLLLRLENSEIFVKEARDAR